MEYDSEDETDSTSNDEETCSKNKEMDKKRGVSLQILF